MALWDVAASVTAADKRRPMYPLHISEWISRIFAMLLPANGDLNIAMPQLEALAAVIQHSHARHLRDLW